MRQITTLTAFSNDLHKRESSFLTAHQHIIGYTSGVSLKVRMKGAKLRIVCTVKFRLVLRRWQAVKTSAGTTVSPSYRVAYLSGAYTM